MDANIVYEAHRRDSFKHWPFAATEKCSIERMAEAGFYWCGTATEPDSAACFMCRKVLDNWESDDDPWSEHRKHCPQCHFVRLGRPEAQLTVDEFLGVLQKLATDTNDRRKQLEEQQVRQQADAARDQIQKHFRHK